MTVTLENFSSNTTASEMVLHPESDQKHQEVTAVDARFPLIRYLLFTACFGMMSVIIFLILKLLLFCNLAALIKEVTISQAFLSFDPDLSAKYDFSFDIPHESPVNLHINPGRLRIYFRQELLLTLSFSELKFVHKKMIHGRIQGIVNKIDGSMLAGIAEVLIATPFQNDFLTFVVETTATTNEFLCFNRMVDIPFEHSIKIDRSFYTKVKKLFDKQELFGHKLPVIFDSEVNEQSNYAAFKLNTVQNVHLFAVSPQTEWGLAVTGNMPWLVVKGYEWVTFRLCTFEIGSKFDESEDTITLVEFRLPFRPTDEETFIFHPDKYPSLVAQLEELKSFFLSTLNLSVGDVVAGAVTTGEEFSEISLASRLQTTIPISNIITVNAFNFLFGIVDANGISIFSIGLLLQEPVKSSMLEDKTVQVPLQLKVSFVNQLKLWEQAFSDTLSIVCTVSDEVNIYQTEIHSFPFSFFRRLSSDSSVSGLRINFPELMIELENKLVNNQIKFDFKPFYLLYADEKLWCNVNHPSISTFNNQKNTPSNSNSLSTGEESSHLASININQFPLINGLGNFCKFMTLILEKIDIFSPFQADLNEKMQSFADELTGFMNSSTIKILVLEIAQQIFSPTAINPSALHDEELLRKFISDLFVVNTYSSVLERRILICRSFFTNIFHLVFDSERFLRLYQNSFIIQRILDSQQIKPTFVSELIQKGIDRVFQFNEDTEKAAKRAVHAFIFHPLIFTAIGNWLSEHVIKLAESSHPDSPVWKSIDNAFDTILELADSLKIAEFVKPDVIFASKDGLKLDEIPAVFVRALKNLLEEIIARSPATVKAVIFSEVSRLPRTASIYTIIGTVVMYSGAVSIQKLFQLLGDNMSSKELSTAFEPIKSSLPPMPHKNLEEVFFGAELFQSASIDVLKNIPKLANAPFKKVNYLLHPTSNLALICPSIASATISQGHFGFLPDESGRDIPIFVKVMKETAYESFNRELKMVSFVIEKFPTVQEVFEKIMKAYKNEFNFHLEIQYMQLAKVYYENAFIKVPVFLQAYQYPLKSFQQSESVTSKPLKICHMIVMEFINGISIDKLTPKRFFEKYTESRMQQLASSDSTKAKQQPTISDDARDKIILDYFLYFYDLLIKLYSQFMTIGIFGNGFIHGDLHGGNIFYQIDYVDMKKTLIVPIDYGNCHKLSPELQTGILDIGLGVETQNAMTVIQGLGYPNNGKYIGEDERLWKKILGDVHYYFEFFKYDNIKKKEFFMQKLAEYNIWYFFYQIEYRIMGDLEESGKYYSFCKQLKNHFAVLKEKKDVKKWNLQNEQLLNQVELLLLSVTDFHDTITLSVAKYCFIAAKTIITSSFDDYSYEFDKIFEPIQSTLKGCISIEKNTLDLLTNLRKYQSYSRESFILFTGQHGQLLDLLGNSPIVKKKETTDGTDDETVISIDKLKSFALDLIMPKGSIANENEIRIRLLEYVSKNEIRYLSYIRDHLIIVRNTWAREQARISEWLNDASNRTFIKTFDHYFDRALNFRKSELPTQETVGLVIAIPGWGEKNLGRGSEIMNYYRSESSLSNCANILLDILLMIPGFSKAPPTCSDIAKKVAKDNCSGKMIKKYFTSYVANFRINFSFEHEKPPLRPSSK